MFNKQIDFLAIGDIVTDAFIRIKDASVHCNINHTSCELCMRFGDKIPFESVEVVTAVGNGPNAAVSAARLGLRSAVMTNVGRDQNGDECLEQLKVNGVSREFVTRQAGKKTNYHYVLWYEDERTILVKHEAFDYKFEAPRKNPRWVYVTSLGKETIQYQLDIAEWLNKNPDVKLMFQPGTFQMSAGLTQLMPLYKRADVFVCNVEEARRILGNETGDVKELMTAMREMGPKITLITDGPKGAYAYDGTDFWFMPPYPDPKPPYERTGAGDAFASTFASALALSKTVPEALQWAPINSMSVVQQVGAQRGLLSHEELTAFLKNAPADYVPKKI